MRQALRRPVHGRGGAGAAGGCARAALRRSPWGTEPSPACAEGL